MMFGTPVSNRYRRPVLINAIVQSIIIVMVGLGDRFDNFARTVVFICLSTYWLSFMLIFARHPNSPTKGDVVWVYAGFGTVFITLFAICEAIWHRFL